MDTIMHLLQFTDSTFPVGTFSFSNGLETAAFEHIVKDAATLEEYTRSVALQAAFSDGVAALLAFRSTKADDYQATITIDRQLILFKMNDEARLMLTRMGKKMAELGTRLFDQNDMFARWIADIEAGVTPGTYPVAQGMAFALAQLNEQQLFASHQYGVINMVLSAALRCVRVSHYDTQQILFKLSDEVPELFERARTMTFEDMNAFVPEMDIMASMHEKGTMRMFMN